MKKRIQNSILSKMILATILLIIIPFITVNILTYRLNYNESLEDTRRINESFLGIGLDLLVEYIDGLKSIPLSIYENPQILNLLQQDEEYSSDELFFLRQEMRHMISQDQSIRMVTLQSRNGTFLTQEEIGSDNEKLWREARYGLDNGQLQAGYDERGNPTVLRFSTTLIDVPSNDELVKLTFYAVPDTLTSIANKVGANVTKGVNVWIQTIGNDTPLYQTTQEEAIFTEFRQGYVVGNLGDTSGYFFVGRTDVRGETIEVIKFVPEQVILGTLYELFFHVSALQVIILVSAMLFIWFIYRTIIFPIKRIASNIDKVQEGEYRYLPIHKANDEVGVLDQKYAEMVATINNLVNETLMNALEISKSRLKILQAQINPHFLNNMLQTISTQALRAGDQDTSDTITMLARFFQYNLDTTTDFVPLSEEIKHIQIYLNLQKARFREKLLYQIRCDESIKHGIVPKMILQPLVENSLKHGLTSGDDGGYINVEIHRVNGNIIIQIIDNGSGFTKEKIESLRAGYSHYEITPEAGHGIGFLNVLQRLAIYTEDFHWEVESEPWKRTTITLTFGGSKF